MPNWAKVYLGDSRAMTEVEDGGVDLAVTSPPYWHIKDYGVAGQLGYGQSLHEYLKDLYRVWRECFRVLREGARLAPAGQPAARQDSQQSQRRSVGALRRVHGIATGKGVG